MRPKLAVVEDPPLPDPPYPSDTAAKGWRFELDMERIRKSDTWVLTPRDMRPWLVMTWIVAFEQIPAGSLPSDHRLIAAHIGMDERAFTANADMLLRGFVLYGDGRLYHPVVCSRVEKLLAYREGERVRKKNYRASKTEKQEVKGRCPTGQIGDFSGTPAESHGNPAPEPEPEPEPEDKRYSPDGESATSDPEATPAAKRQATPFRKILEIYREALPMCEQPLDVEHWTPARKAAIRARWQNQLPDLDSWRECFELVAESKFLTGQSHSPGRKPFTASLFWIAKPENLLKIYEGKYRG